MLNKRIGITTHAINQFAERNFDGVKDVKKIKRLIFRDLSPLNIKRIEKKKVLKQGTEYHVWVKGGKQYRVIEEENRVVVITVIQQNRNSNKYANIK